MLTRGRLLPLLAVTSTICHGLPPEVSPASSEPNATARGAVDLSTVHVAYASDLNTTKSLLAGMLSVARNLKDPASCVIHLIVPREKVEEAARLAACFKEELRQLERTAPEVQVHEEKKHQIDVTGRFLQAEHRIGITRLFLHEYLPQVPRVIWLDTDTIVTSDLATLYRHPMEHSVAAVREGAPRSFRVLYHMLDWRRLHAAVPNPDLLAFNAGVLLFDLERWGSNRTVLHVQEWASLLKNAGPQLLLNLVSQVSGNFTELDSRWNVFGLGGLFPPRLGQAQKAHILHWSGTHKPWARKLSNRRFANMQGALHKVGVRMPDLGHEKFDYLIMPYLPSDKCGEPVFVSM